MASLQDLLLNLTAPTADDAERIRDTLLAELTVPTQWTVTETDIEIAQDETHDWFLAAFHHKSNPDKRASVFLLEGSNALQLHLESPDTDEWSEPTQDPADITALLRGY